MSISVYIPDVHKFIHKTEAEFIKRMVQRIPSVVKLDNQLPIIEVSLYANGEPYIIPPNMDCKINLIRKDQVPINKSILGCNPTRTSIYFEIDEQMSFYSGELNLVVEVYIGSGSDLMRVSSQPILITID